MERKVKRSYVSPKRTAQATATREAILNAATRLFSTEGYVATTIQVIADEADVAVQTVYAVFGNKRELLREVVETAVTGDADPIPVNERARARAIAEEPDGRKRAEMDAEWVAEISPRIAPITRVVREAAAVDPDFASTAAQITAQRRADMRAAAKVLGGPDGLSGDLEDKIGTLLVLYSSDVFRLLTEELGWSLKRYERWVADMLYRAVIT